MQFEFEGGLYTVPAEAMTYAGDVVELPDGRFLTITCLESYPPVPRDIRISDGPTNVGTHEGRAWKATFESAGTSEQ